jgi:FkbM family methyltransferase
MVRYMEKIVPAMVSHLILAPCDKVLFLRRFFASAGITPNHFGKRAVRVPIPNYAGELRISGAATHHLSFQMFWRGINYYEPFTRTVIEWLARSTEFFFDVGANIGFFSLIAAKMNPRLRVIAFEPNPTMYGILSENKRLNDLSNLTAEPLALSNQEGESTLFLSESDMSASLVPGFQDFSPSIGSVLVRANTLDGYLKRFEFPRTLLLKIDVEGHELAVLEGAMSTINTFKPDIIIEVLDDFDPSMLEQLRRLGYRFYKITHQGLIESNTITLTRIGDFIFFNYLFTTRALGEVYGISEKLRELAQDINLYHTSKFPGHPV